MHEESEKCTNAEAGRGLGSGEMHPVTSSGRSLRCPGPFADVFPLWFAGPPQQYSGQEDYYGDQYSHGGQGPPEGMNQQYYPDGNLP